MADLCTPFRERYERSRGLDLEAQIEECADYLQYPDILITEFLEAYYRVERELDPDREDEKLDASLAELVLEPFSGSSEFQIRRGGRAGPRARGYGSAPRASGWRTTKSRAA